MTDLATLRLLSGVAILFALVLAALAMTTRFSSGLPAYLTFLFIALIGSFAERSVRALDRRVSALESGRQF
jgi:hypothetical protein